jgi:hypothetical protein
MKTLVTRLRRLEDRFQSRLAALRPPVSSFRPQ